MSRRNCNHYAPALGVLLVVISLFTLSLSFQMPGHFGLGIYHGGTARMSVGRINGFLPYSLPLKIIEGTAGPDTPKPVYDDEALPDKLFLAVFRAKLAQQMGKDVATPGYTGLMELIAVLNDENADKDYVQNVARMTLLSLFPGWLPPAFSALFSQNIPNISCRMNAWVTLLTCGWLMGPEMELNDVEMEDGTILRDQGLLVKRCRFLEESGCASVCVNTCKVPTQTFFAQDMGLPLTMEPNYEDFSCQFSFGKVPPKPDQDPAFHVGCLSQCPSKGSVNDRCHKIECN
mmetsp:Transcript_3521/g.4953  ORF Transcript_3521/g.4953 Transcript_3521/m.4953 type:complete len:289 (+) Transcript_3521:101-967(+)